MSRAVKPDYLPFDRMKFSEKLMEAKGDRSQKAFADECQLSAGHLNRYFNCQKLQPPTPSTLWKIAAAAQNNVSYQDLLQAAGYDYRKYDNPRVVEMTERIETNLKYRRAVINSIIVSALGNHDYIWTSLPGKETSPYDFGIKLEGAEIDTWYFGICLSVNKNEVNTEEHMKQRLFMYYGALAFMPPARKVKMSIVTDVRETYNRFKSLSPTVSSCVSVILVDVDNFLISDETYLNTMSAEADAEMKNLYPII